MEIRLEGNPGTGYVWQYDPQASTRPELVEVESVGYIAPDTDRIGAPTLFSFTVTPLAAGSVTLAFDYLRPWEKEALRRETRRIEISP